MKLRVLIIGIIILLEIISAIIVNSVTGDLDTYYSLTSRYSARLSFVILSILAIWIIINGLSKIFNNNTTQHIFIGSLLGFSVNHLIHLYFLYRNFEVNNLELLDKLISFGALAYLILIVFPFYIIRIRKLSKNSYLLVHGYLVLMISICVFTYSTRLGRVEPLPLTSPMILFKALIAIGVGLVLGLLWRSLRFGR